MYIPAHFEVEDRAELIRFMRLYNFAAVVTSHEGELTATHIPLVVREDESGVSLVGHVARASRTGLVNCSADVLVIFTGPHAYVSPSLYESKLSVPTWNYTAVHAYGNRTIIDAEPALMALVDATEPAYRKQWDQLPEEFRKKMIGGVVAFEIRVTRLEGKYKLSQNRPAADQARVTESFEGTELGEFMKKILFA